MNIKQAIKKAVSERNAEAAAALADVLRFDHGFNYEDIYSLVNNTAPIDKADWEALMYEGDTQ